MEKCIAIQVTRFAEFHDFGNRRETTLDLKHQKLETERGEITRAAPTHPFYGEWNVMSSSFVNYRHHLIIL